MKMPVITYATVTAASLLMLSPVILGQTSAVKLFDSVNVRSSANATSFQNRVTFNSTTLNLSCPVNAAIQAKLSSTADGTGNVLVDNFLNVRASQGTNTGAATNVCRGGVIEGSTQEQDCFTSSYQSAATAGSVVGKNPDTFADTGGVTPIDISSSLLPGDSQTTIDLVDAGGYLASTSLYLQSNCTLLGVSGPAEITGNPISQSNPTPQELTQNFTFNPLAGQVVQFTYDLSEAYEAGQLAITDATIPGTADLPLTPAQFLSYVAGTSFANSNCLLHSGELVNGQPACKLYTLECSVGTNSAESGARCPISQLPNEIFKETFDGPGFTLPDITPITPGGPTFHQGVGFLMASEGWSGPGCTFDSASGLQNLLCPQNLLTSFTGPGVYSDTGRGTHPNSSFITVAPVPEDLTTVSVDGARPGGWINSSTAVFHLSSEPPSLPSVSAFVAAPIKSLTYGISTPDAVPMPGAAIASDTVLLNPIACPTPTNPAPALIFAPLQPQTITGLSDGYYLLHYFAQDCAGTEELKFSKDGNGSWSTGFYTVPINVDTVTPIIATGPSLSPAPGNYGGVGNSYYVNEPVSATYSCSDSLSGIVRCGTSTFSTPTPNTSTLSSSVDTSTPGTKTFTVTAIDAAGNQSTASVQYRVVPSDGTVDLGILKVAPFSVTSGSTLPYDLVIVNSGKNTASSIVISDPLPPEVAFVSARILTVTCNWKGCSSSIQGDNCSVTGNVVSCTANTLEPLSRSTYPALYVRILVRPAGSVGSVLRNTANVTSANRDTNTGNNTSTATTRVK